MKKLHDNAPTHHASKDGVMPSQKADLERIHGFMRKSPFATSAPNLPKECSA
jgi:hypothetical protein